ncbi:MAG: fasciclin domain-containing protein [Paludibacter sp.]|nr:fasciclin domain-containing protein [Paludibacter sp.]
MNCKYIYKSIFTLLFPAVILLLNGCNDAAWESHVGNDEFVKKNLYQAIGEKPELSIYYNVLKKTGYNEILETSNSYTVFAPANSAWSGVDTSSVDNLTKLIGMTIAYKTYFTDNTELYTEVKAVNDKNIFYDATDKTFNGAKLIDPDYRTSNGVLHVTDKIVERKENIWSFISTLTESSQYKYIKSLNETVMDEDKSVAVGVYPDGRTKYDTIWKNINNFLSAFPIDNEDSIYTYVMVENTGFDMLYTKYKPYFKMSSDLSTDSLTRFNICGDFVFNGLIDITKVDTLENVSGVKVPLAGVTISRTYDASNGRVYVINQSNIRLKDKIKPIKIEGEDFINAYDKNYVFTRYKRWASGERDIALSCGETQSDSLWRKVPLAPDTVVKKDSVASKTYFINSNLVANVANFYIEYTANVNSTNYDVYYVAYDDISDHFDSTYTSYGVYKVVQKLFVSMPGAKKLVRGTTDNGAEVVNNYLGNMICFAGEGYAGVHELTKLKKWSLIQDTQILDTPLTTADADVMSVAQSGTMTMWLCNAARSTTASRQGLLFLDYILLVPRITEE